jgi:Domain of unknown function (DUF4365)
VAKRKPIPRKRRTREHIIADLSVNHVERHVLLCGYTVERHRHDYGLDLLMSTYDRNGEVENGEVRLQLKATDHLKASAARKSIVFRVQRSDLRAWVNEPMPVILVVYDAPADTAYWLYVQAYLEKQPGFDPSRGTRTVTLRIPRSGRLDLDAVRKFARYKDSVLAQQKGLVHHE